MNVLVELLWGAAIALVIASWWLTRRAKRRTRLKMEALRAEHWRMDQRKFDRMPLRHAQGHPSHVPRRTSRPLEPVPKTKVQSNEPSPTYSSPIAPDYGTPAPYTSHTTHDHSSHYSGEGGSFGGGGASGGWDSGSSSSSSSSSSDSGSSSSSSDSGSSSGGSSE